MTHPPDLPIAIMDANCALCSFGARLIHRLDRTGDIRILPMQTDRGRALLREHGLDPDDPTTWLYLENGTATEGFDALIKIAQRGGALGRIVGLLRLIPCGLRHRIYLWIARNRYRLFGRKDMCALPDPGLRARLIQ